MLDKRIREIKIHFGIEFIHWQRSNQSGVLLSSGCGIGLGVMDICEKFNWFCDIDNYRNHKIDWEALAISLCAKKPKIIAAVGWFTLDKPIHFINFQKGICNDVPFFLYQGGGKIYLENFLGLLK